MKYELKPLKVGGILDQAILILKDRFGLFLTILLCLQIPVAIVINLIITDKVPMLAPNPSPEELAESLQTQLNFLVSVMMPVSFLMLLIVTPVMNCALVHAAARVYLGKPVGVRRAFRAGILRTLPLLWTWTLLGLFMAGRPGFMRSSRNFNGFLVCLGVDDCRFGGDFGPGGAAAELVLDAIGLDRALSGILSLEHSGCSQSIWGSESVRPWFSSGTWRGLSDRCCRR